MAELSLREHLRRARERRWKGKTKKDKQAAASLMSRAYWDSLSPAQRSAEMKRRAAVRARNKARAR